MWSERNSDVYQSCFSPYLLPVTIVSGTFFNGLNSFWFYKIVRKIQRKVGGQEGVKAGNELTDAEREREEAERQKMKQTKEALLAIPQGHALTQDIDTMGSTDIMRKTIFYTARSVQCNTFNTPHSLLLSGTAILLKAARIEERNARIM
eukprot:CAMPEP_0172444328 /NCGR_PEP_ID=MMETSP1065-20121228/4391_1 /TAXON_ID=265537 /ORGANISM="Amphiprora paludosa, Strain CCMP125" /LENGTH=148 /DNA_ID=CAMNT_0013194817 /DNA_START=121 /DNA_END=565 /DNA_ORIENTATION=-